MNEAVEVDSESREYVKLSEHKQSLFWGKVEKNAGDDGCWKWVGGLDGHGYGQFRTDAGNLWRCHRLSWAMANGPILGGLHVLHSCDNPPCVNPNHLWLGTNMDNVRDKRSKGRERHPFGEANPSAKLCNQKVTQIRMRYAAGGITQMALASQFGVSHPTIKRVLYRQNWKHVI